VDEINVWFVLFAAHIKSDPVYSFVLDAVPLTIVSIFGAMVEQLNSPKEITARNTAAAVVSAISVGIATAVAAREIEIKIPLQVLIALGGGMKGKTVLHIITGKILNLVKKFNV
jgi:hypothetical protein